MSRLAAVLCSGVSPPESGLCGQVADTGWMLYF